MQSNAEPRTVGIIGGGQLAMMMAESAPALDIKVHLQTPNPSDSALHSEQLNGNDKDTIFAQIDDAVATAKLANHASVITFENEFVNLTELAKLSSQGVCFRPPLSSLQLVLDKFDQRSQLKAMGLPVPNFAALTSEQSPEDLGFTYPVVIKARRHGYDGQGTHIMKNSADLQAFWAQNQSATNDAFMVESFVPFDKELAVIAARSLSGDVAIYPIVETYQPEQVCRWAIAPVLLGPGLESKISHMATRLLHQLDYVGILALELFLTKTGEVLVNELAPRTHNSGHLTIEACETSQFAQHLRAIAGMPLGATTMTAPTAVMVNLLGFETGPSNYQAKLDLIRQHPSTTVHWYHKQESRVGRKLGHVTVLLDQCDRHVAIAAAEAIEALWYPG